jgi:hypothetical protein
MAPHRQALRRARIGRKKIMKSFMLSLVVAVAVSAFAAEGQKEAAKEATKEGTIVLKDGSRIEARSITESLTIVTTADKTQTIRTTDVDKVISSAALPSPAATDATARPASGTIVLKDGSRIEARSITESVSITTAASDKTQTISKTDIKEIVTKAQGASGQPATKARQ